MFSAGSVAVPAAGMQQMPEQLAGRLKPETLISKFRAARIETNQEGFTISSEDGRSFSGKRLVLAVAEYELRRLMDELPEPPADVRWNRTTTFYFAADGAPVGDAILVLNGEGEKGGPVNNAVVMSNVSRVYAPAGGHLISASVVGRAPQDSGEISALESEVRRHLQVWFGAEVARWKFLRAYPIQHALPLQETAKWNSGEPRTNVPGLYRAGDAIETASIQGALVSGRRAAEALIADAKAGIP